MSMRWWVILYHHLMVYKRDAPEHWYMSTRRQLKRVCFTLNNYGEDDETRIQGSTDLYQYAIYGRETAPNTGTRHLQGNVVGVFLGATDVAQQRFALSYFKNVVF